MILTKEIAEDATARIDGYREKSGFDSKGICLAVSEATTWNIRLQDKPDRFWGVHRARYGVGGFYRFPMTPEGDIKRRAFIDSLIGKDL